MVGYYNTIQAVDDCVGKIFEVLEQTGCLDNTIIVFAGDNGFFFKEHHRGDKRLAYESSIRIPLVMRYPKLIPAGASIEKMVFLAKDFLFDRNRKCVTFCMNAFIYFLGLSHSSTEVFLTSPKAV